MSPGPWEDYAQPAAEPDGPWKAYQPQQPAQPEEPAPVPQAFLDRVRAGSYLTADIGGAMPEATADFFKTFEGSQIKGAWDMFTLPGRVASGETKLDTGAGMNEAVGMGVGIALGRMNEMPGNGAGAPVIDQGSGRFARPIIDDAGKPQVAPIGSLPVPEDFTNAAKVLAPESISSAAVRVDGKIYAGGNHLEAVENAAKSNGESIDVALDKMSGMDPKDQGFVTSEGRYVDRAEAGRIAKQRDQISDYSGGRYNKNGDLGIENLKPDYEPAARVEQNLKQMWQEDGIHPAEAVHDAQTDAFFKHDVTDGRPAFQPSYTPPDPLDLAMSGSLNVEAAERASEGVKQYYKDVESHIFGDRAEEWSKLNRQADRASVNMNDNLSRELRERQSKLEDEVGMTPSDEDLLGGAGLPDTYDPEFWKGLKEDLHEIELGRDESLATVAHQVRYLPKTRDWDAMNNSERQSTLVILSALNAEKTAGRNPMAFLKEAFQQRKARYGGGADASEIVEAQMNELKNLMDGAIERSGVTAPDLRALPAPKAQALPTPEDVAVLEETGGAMPRSLGAAATTEAPLVSPSVQPARPPGSLAASFTAARDKLMDVGRDVQMLTAPMATGTRDSMAIAKDFANSMRRNRWDWSRIDKDIADRFTPEQRARMWNAADEESLSLRLEEPASMREHQGLATLEPAERAAVEELQTRSQNAWVRARDLGMVEGEGLPAYTPRMIINVASAGSRDTALALDGIGGNLRTKTGNLLKRKYMESQDTQAAAQAKYGDQAMLARDIRVLPLATSQLEDAIAGRTLINSIKEYGERTGAQTVSEGAIPAGSDAKFFTLDHPSFKTWRPKFEEGKALKDENGNPIFEQVPLYVHGDFEGPLRAVLSSKSGATYGAMMALKGKTMSLIMNSPMIHNAVEWGRAFPAAPFKAGTFKVYFEGNAAKNNVPLMHEAIDNGLVPIGHRFFNQDITSVMESPDLSPGRSLTSKILAAVPGLFDEAAGTAVKQAIDKAGDFWHNTLLWDRVADLQMGLYKNFLDAGIDKGLDRATSAKVAAHLANRYAGSLPKEAMSDISTKWANGLLFSRSFTIGNLGVMKDMFTGLPKDVMAQIERDAGFRAGSINEAGEEGSIPQDAAALAKSMARRKAISTVVLDVGLLYAGNSIMQSALNVMLGSNTLDQEAHGYVRRFRDYLDKGSQNPLSMLWPSNITALSSTSENEPGLENRLKIGHTKDGTAIYARNPVGKIGEEFVGWGTSPLDILKRKEGTLARPALQILSNDAGFGRKIYDPEANTPVAMAGTVWAIAKHLFGSQLPEGQIGALSDLVTGQGDKTVNELQLAGPLAGVTFRKGAPGGEAVGEMYHNKSAFEFRVQQAMPDIRKQILRGDIAGAQQVMTGLGMDGPYSRWVIKTTQNPATRLGAKALGDFYRTASPEQRERMTRIQQAPQQP